MFAFDTAAKMFTLSDPHSSYRMKIDADGHMVKVWQTTSAGTYYFDPVYGTMAKGTVTIDGRTCRFDGNTGILQ